MTGQTISERMLHHRAVDAVVWAMPLMNFKGYRDALVNAGVGRNDVGYFSEIQDWRFQTATPNNTTPYVLMHWTVTDGPIVVEVPASSPDVGIFGTLMDAWQRPIDDVGSMGRDRGRGAKYLLLPDGYTGPLLPDAFFVAMAVTIIFGLIVATVLTMLIVPVLYATLYRVPASNT